MKPTLKQLIEGATPGKWTSEDIGHGCSVNPSIAWLGNGTHHPYSETKVNAQLIARCNPETMAKVLAELTWIAERGWNPHGTTIENAHLAYDCHCVAAQLIALLNSPFP